MTLYETGIVKDKVDFEDLVVGRRIKNTENTLDINEIAKLCARQIDEAEQSLLTIAKKLTSKGANPPISMVIISGTAPYSYTTKSGVSVVPIGCLGFDGKMGV